MRSLQFLMAATVACTLACGGTRIEQPKAAVSESAANASETELERLRTQVRDGDETALARLRVLAESGQAEAQATLAASHANIRALKDPVVSAKWFLAAARQGLPGAQASIGWAYLHGRGVEKDVEKGLIWSELGADQGQWVAAGSLAHHYRGERRDEPGDFVQAYRWFTVSMRIAQSDEREDIEKIVRKQRTQIADRMTAEEIAEAERLAAGWVQKDWSELQSRLDQLG